MTGSNSGTLSYEIKMIGEAALDLLSACSSGTVLASVSGAIYLLCEQDELLWLVSQASPMHRRCVRVSSALPRIQVGESFHSRDGRLVTGTGQTLEFADAPVWKPPVLSVGKVIPVSHLGGLVQLAYQSLAAQKQSGWGVLIPAILKIASGQAEPEVTGNGFVLPGNVWPAVRGILLAGLARNFDPIPPYAAALVGLGTGLTPSGDDFLSGLSFASAFLRCAYPEVSYLQTRDYTDFILGCKTQTNLISFTLLKDHSQGHTWEPFHRFANGLQMGQPDGQLLPFAVELAAVGHSTGWDILTGFLVGVSLAFPQ
jgi:hypothetical protein